MTAGFVGNFTTPLLLTSSITQPPQVRLHWNNTGSPATETGKYVRLSSARRAWDIAAGRFVTGLIHRLRTSTCPVADNLEQRAEWTAEFFRKAFARPEFVGWHYCGLIDAPNLIPRKQDRQHSGLLDGYGEPYTALQQVIEACTDEMYEIATGLL